MSPVDRSKLAAFVAQRMELGDTEWFFRPDREALAGTDQAPVRKEPAAVLSKAAPAKPVAPAERLPAAQCAAADFTVADIETHGNLDELRRAVCGCMRCPLGSRRKHFVFGDGNPDADIMFIGEAPGQDEDEQGLPFVGRAGKLLTKMIEAIKLSRGDVYIGNILKCRPPGNRDPLPEEIERCEPILIRQIGIIRPRIICALGRISGQTLLRTKSTLGALRGKVHDYHGVKLIVTYHPAALLRNPNWKPGAWEDLKFLRREYDGMEVG